MASSASELARRLARDAEAVCRVYLSNGRRAGNHWIVGDVRNSRGRSMHVRLKDNCPRVLRAIGSTRRRASMATCSTSSSTAAASWSSAMWPTRPGAFSAYRDPKPTNAEREPPAARGSPEAARRLFAMSTADRRHARRTLPRRPRHSARGMRTRPAVPSGLLLSRSRDRRDADAPRADRCRHRPRRAHHRPAADLARSRRRRQGACCRSPPLAGSPAWQRHLARPRSRHARPGHGRRRRPRDDGLAQDRDAFAADGRRHLGQSPRGPRPSRPAASASTSRPTRTLPAGTASSVSAGEQARPASLALVLRPQLGDFNDDLRGLGPDRLAAWLRDQLVPDDARLHLQPG